jgi:hypothetical protein
MLTSTLTLSSEMDLANSMWSSYHMLLQVFWFRFDTIYRWYKYDIYSHILSHFMWHHNLTCLLTYFLTFAKWPTVVGHTKSGSVAKGYQKSIIYSPWRVPRTRRINKHEWDIYRWVSILSIKWEISIGTPIVCGAGIINGKLRHLRTRSPSSDVLPDFCRMGRSTALSEQRTVGPTFRMIGNGWNIQSYHGLSNVIK